MYPDRYRLPEVTAHVLAMLERRLPGLRDFDAAAEAELLAEARRALHEVHAQFREIADDPTYWEALERSVLEVALPRWLLLARDHHLELRAHFGIWRDGDLLSRLFYAGVGAVGAAVVALTAIPDWIEPLPLVLFLGGPFIPDLQEWYSRRRHTKRLAAIVEDMRREQQQQETYRPLAATASVPAPVETAEVRDEPVATIRQKERA